MMNAIPVQWEVMMNTRDSDIIKFALNFLLANLDEALDESCQGTAGSQITEKEVCDLIAHWPVNGITSRQAEQAVECGGRIAWTDQQLEDQINVLNIVITYLSGRNDAGIIRSVLRRELHEFEGFQEARKNKKC
jgi:hypothetical protein